MIYFVTENYLKVNTPITANVDVTDVFPYVKPASDMRVQAILGSYSMRIYWLRITLKH